MKRVDRLVEACALLADSGASQEAIRLAIVGSGPLRAALEKRVGKLRLAGRVRFLGGRAHDEVALWMNAADCLCLPSLSEGMPNVVIEALACGVPVVATDVGEVPFLVKDGVNGFVVNGADDGLPARLAESLRLCLAREWDRSSIAGAMGGFTWEAAVRRILEGIEAAKEA